MFWLSGAEWRWQEHNDADDLRLDTITAGQLIVLGTTGDPQSQRIKYQMGVVPQKTTWTNMNVLKNLLVYARYFDMSAHWRWSAHGNN